MVLVIFLIGLDCELFFFDLVVFVGLVVCGYVGFWYVGVD